MVRQRWEGSRHTYLGHGKDRKSIGIEWSIPSSHYMIRFTRDDMEDEWIFGIAFGLLSFYIILSGFGRRFFRQHYVPDEGWSPELKLAFFDNAVWWNFWTSDDVSDPQTPRWRRGSWHPLDTLLGPTSCHDVPISVTETVLPMPEGEYALMVRLYQTTWRRPRWPWPWQQIARAHIEVVGGGVPVPGKGENSYDIDDDAVYSSTVPAATVEGAVAAFAADILRTRQRRGGTSWRPGA